MASDKAQNVSANAASLNKLAILTSGGDAPGMNSAVRAATMFARAAGAEVFGARYGYRGLLNADFVPLEVSKVAGIIRDGGTILGSARCPEIHTPDGRETARDNLASHGFDGLLVIGGDGTLTGAEALTNPDEAGEFATRVVGIPASIDNDIGLTGMAIGVDTAMNTIMEACDNIVDTASAFDRTFIVEVMGRRSGYLAMTAGVAAGADAVLFPEARRTEEELVDAVVKAALEATRHEDRPRSALIVKAEGTALSPEQLRERVDERLAKHSESGEPAVETRVTVLGHVVRGGRPSAFDRVVAGRLAHAAVTALFDGETRKMAAWMMPVEPPEEVAERSPADPYCWLVDLEAVLAETLRMQEGTSPLVEWRARIFDDIEDVLMM
ncbi:MAG: 6-phosphofructokinase [Myxococcota bacterium]